MSHSPEQPEPVLDLEALRRRRPDAVGTWFNTYADAVYAFVFYRVGKDPDLAADVAQDTFVTALGKIRDFDPERGEMFPWLTYIARNRIRKTVRRRLRHRTVSDFWDVVDRRLTRALSELGESPLPDELLERKETEDLVQIALSNLPFRYQRALRGHYFEDRPVRELAALEGMTEGAVKVLLHRARLAFRAAFETIAATLQEKVGAGRALP